MDSNDEKRTSLTRLALLCKQEQLISHSDLEQILASIHDSDLVDDNETVIPAPILTQLSSRLNRHMQDLVYVNGSAGFERLPHQKEFVSEQVGQVSTGFAEDLPPELPEPPESMSSDLKVNHFGRLVAPTITIGVLGLIVWVMVLAKPIIEDLLDDGKPGGTGGQTGSSDMQTPDRNQLGATPSLDTVDDRVSVNETASDVDIPKRNELPQQSNTSEPKIVSNENENADGTSVPVEFSLLDATHKLVAIGAIDQKLSLERFAEIEESIRLAARKNDWEQALRLVQTDTHLNGAETQKLALYEAGALLALDKTSAAIDVLVSDAGNNLNNEIWQRVFAAALIKSNRQSRATAKEAIQAFDSDEAVLLRDWIDARSGEKTKNLKELARREADFETSFLDGLFLVLAHLQVGNDKQTQFSLRKAVEDFEAFSEQEARADEPLWLRKLYMEKLADAIQKLQASKPPSDRKN